MTLMQNTATVGMGFLDRVDNFMAMGWAVSPNDRYEIVDITVDGVSVAKVAATQYRTGLQKVGHGDGFCAFRHEFDPPIGIFHDAVVEVRQLSSGQLLNQG